MSAQAWIGIGILCAVAGFVVLAMTWTQHQNCGLVPLDLAGAYGDQARLACDRVNDVRIVAYAACIIGLAVAIVAVVRAPRR